MAHFSRRTSAPEISGQNYRRFRAAVRDDFRSSCAYCLLNEKWAAGKENFEIDHFRPQSLFPQLALSFYNLYWSCHVCNKFKGPQWPSKELQRAGTGFVDLCEEEFADHFTEMPNGVWVGKTLSAIYSIEALRLNRTHLVELRRLLSEGALQQQEDL